MALQSTTVKKFGRGNDDDGIPLSRTGADCDDESKPSLVGVRVKSVMNRQCILSGANMYDMMRLKNPASIEPSATDRMKYNDADESFLQKKQLEHFHKRYSDLIRMDKVEKLSSLSVGEYRPEHNDVILRKVKGKILALYGHAAAGDHLLYVEEAAFLMDAGNLFVMQDGVPLSIQEAHNLFFKSEKNLLDYLVYSYLRRFGYIVFRHNTLMKHEKAEVKGSCKRPLQESKLTNDKNVKKGKAENVSLELNSIGPSSEKLTQPLHENGETSATSDMNTTAVQGYYDFVYWADSQAHIVSSNNNVLPWMCDEQCRVQFDRDMLETLKDFLPEYVHEVPLSASSNAPVTSNCGLELQCFSVTGCRATIEQHSTTSWSEFKKVHQARLKSICNELQQQSLAAQGSRPHNIKELLEKFQLIRSVSLTKDLHVEKIASNSQQDITFDVYQPNSLFQKSSPGIPHHRVIVVRSCDESPSLPDLHRLKSQPDDDVPIYWAVCDHGDISFYCFTNVMIPKDNYRKSSRYEKKS